MAIRTVTLTFKDEKGQLATAEFNTPAEQPISGTYQLAYAVLEAVFQFTDCAIVGAKMTEDMSWALTDHMSNDVLEGADVEEGALFVFRAANNKPVEMRIPAVREDCYLAGTKQVDLANGNIDAFVDLMINGYNSVEFGEARPCDKRGNDITSLDSAKEQFKPRKGG